MTFRTLSHLARRADSWPFRIIVPVMCALLFLALPACQKGPDDAPESARTVNFLPNTYIDSLYVKYVDSDGLKRVSNANNLLAAIFEEETADSLIQFTTNEDPQIMDAFVNYWMGEYFCYSSRFQEAEDVSLIALSHAPRMKDEGFQIEIYSLLGLISQRLGKNEAALQYMQKCYEASSKSGNLEDQSSDLSNLAAIALALGNAKLAKSYVDKAIVVESKIGRDAMLAIRYGIASEVYQSLGQLDKAEKFAREAYALDKAGGRDGKAAIRLSQLAAVLIAKNENDEAVEILLQAVPALEANGNSYSRAVVENQLGTLFLERNEFPEATRHFQQAYDASQEAGNLIFLQRALDGLANSLKPSDINQAYAYLAQSATLTDSIHHLNDKKQLAEIEQKYRESEALRQSESRAYERKIQNYVLIIILSISILVISALFFVIRSKNKGQKIMKSVENMRSNFFTNVTHEFRTPITVIMGLSQDIAENPACNKEVRGAADVITAQGRGMLDLVNQLLDISKVKSEIGTPDWRRGNVVSYMHMIAEKYTQTASHKGIDMVFSPSENTIVMDFIPQYMHKIMHNLISNSLKFTQKGGRIYISTNVRDNALHLRIADTGVGIDRDDLGHIFEPYFQGDNSNIGMGTGIGLSLVDQMVKAMNGLITVKSVKGKGSIFTITIPLTHDGTVEELESDDELRKDFAEPDIHDEPDVDLEEAHEGDAPEEKPIVLIVEDHPDVASYIGSHLPDYNVHYARNGREGLVKAKELIPDVIVTDLMMPEMDGLEMTRDIRADGALSHVPVIVITAKADSADKIKALQTGVDAYLVKPFNRDELEVRVSQLIQQRRMLCEKYQRAIAAGNLDTDELPVADRQFISNLVGVVYSLLANNESTDLEVVAARLNMTSRSLARKLQALTGESPLQYINKIKVSKAKSIIDSDQKIALSDVAYQCGFDNPNYFSRIFKQIAGMSPTAYRRRVK